MRPFAVAGLVVATVFAVGGCSGDDGAEPGPSWGSTAPIDGAAELTAAAKKLEEQSLRVAVTMPGAMDVSGVADAKKGRADLTMKAGKAGGNRELRLLLVGADFYLQIVGPEAAGLGLGKGDWLHLDASDVPADSPLNPRKIVDAQTFLGGMVKAEKVGAGSFKGVLDLGTVSAGSTAAPASPGPAAEQVPFTARVDDQGRLTELVVEAGARSESSGGGTVTTNYSDFGVPVTVQAPAKSKVREMPFQLRQALLS
ncbi:hypothetical protein Q0Z83_044030 [Actinoplanes sichuanensis]|uniref:Lipoprotein n=1 Tax=Actinoplanes sichuanensis TaxID=512349 RepID=A0ABW4AYE9_9ACTN|nr:hypothetical protein [Actinoplanes sichuanensis]BEL06212.1 hypothetical protein Q0Z83_044030 [Actinoplanes sichuanensis]